LAIACVIDAARWKNCFEIVDRVPCARHSAQSPSPAYLGGLPAMHRALILVVDSKVDTRHWLWRMLGAQGFGVLEAPNAAAAMRWIEERPDIDALIVDDELSDGRGSDVVRDLVDDASPLAERAVVIASEWRRVMLAGMNVVDRGDLEALVSMLSKWFVPSSPRRVAAQDAAYAR
jgi:CheY-like chemotaxis protein